MLKIHTRDKRLEDGLDFDAIVDRTKGWTGADLENLANEAALLAVRRARTDDEKTPRIRNGDFERILERNDSRKHSFDALDSTVIESASQLSRPTGRVNLRVTSRNEEVIEGELLWADGAFLKILCKDSDQVVLLPKIQVLRLEALEGTETVHADDVIGDRWANKVADLSM